MCDNLKWGEVSSTGLAVASPEHSEHQGLSHVRGNSRRTKTGLLRSSPNGESITSSVPRDNNHRTYVDNHYCDHLRDPEYLLPDDDSSSSKSENTRKKRTHGDRVPFPEKLYTLLNTMDSMETSDIISWMPHGRSFLIHKRQEFVEQIIPR